MCWLFSVGVIFTTTALDHETEASHSFLVMACDGNTNMRQCETAGVRVNVADFNDETPIFDQTSYTTDICYSAAVTGTDLLQPVATDGDSGSNAEIVYSLLTSTSLFGIMPTNGRLYVARNPTSDEIATHTLTVMASDRGESPLSSTTQAIIRVLNCTQTTFYFMQPFHYFEIDEGESSFAGRVGTLDLALSSLPQDITFNPDLPSNPFTNTLNVCINQSSKILLCLLYVYCPFRACD